jgi:hypothetical protein
LGGGKVNINHYHPKRLFFSPVIFIPTPLFKTDINKRTQPSSSFNEIFQAGFQNSGIIFGKTENSIG